MGHGLDERWGGGVWLLGSGKIQFVAATDVAAGEPGVGQSRNELAGGGEIRSRVRKGSLAAAGFNPEWRSSS